MRGIIVFALLLGVTYGTKDSIGVDKTLKKKPEEKIITISSDDYSSADTSSYISPLDLLSLYANGFDLFNSSSSDSSISITTASALASVFGGIAGIFGLFLFPLQIANQVLAIIAISMLIALYARDDTQRLDNVISIDEYGSSYNSIIDSYDFPDWLDQARSLGNSPIIGSIYKRFSEAIEKYSNL